jgi:predicted phage baseplate assembly protein
MSCTGTAECTCGCCAGSSVRTPQLESNLPGLSALSYRVGTWSTFKESMLARLSSADYPALQALTTRRDDDFTVAFLDATAVMLDILTFYQERLANESYLRTAGQLRSLTELSRLIGYRPAPGVSASTYLAFSLKQTPGQRPDPSAPPIVIPQGTKVQSVPAQGQKPQTFETSADFLAKPDWSALPVQTGVAWTPPGAGPNPPGAGALYLSGTSTQLQPGDSLLILGADRENWTDASTPNEQWDVVVLDKVRTDKIRNFTYVAWDKRFPHGLIGATSGDPSSWKSAKVFAFRQKAALFGHNAPNPNLFVSATNQFETSIPELINDYRSNIVLERIDGLSIINAQPQWQWWNFEIPSFQQIDLDATYQKIVAGSWFALVAATGGQVYAQLYKAESVANVSVAKFALSAKVTELAADYQGSNVSDFPLRSTEVWAQSEELEVAELPLSYPLYGAIISLKALRTDLAAVQVIALTGVRQKIAVADGVSTALQFSPADGSALKPLAPGDVLTIIDPSPLPVNPDGTIPEWSTSTATQTLYVQDGSGRSGTVTAALSNFVLAPPGKNDPMVSEYALVTGVDTTSDPAHTRLLLKSPLTLCYDRTATTANANVGLATHGQTVSEILGNGNSSTPNQTFTLKQSPLTYVQAPTPSGRASSLKVRVNNVEWSGVPSLYGESPAASVYTTLNQADGMSDVVFGDGVEGALLPTGQSNVQATYRIGSGAAGNVGSGTLTSLSDRPLGVSGVTNPQAATGGQDPQSVSDIRANAPLTVLTLGRAVSITDYENFARTFAGIAKAHALWIPSGPGRGVFLTVAGAGGAALPPDNPTLGNLVAALRACGNPLIPISVQSYVETLFTFSADVRYDPAYDQPAVESELRGTLSRTFSFASRDFGEAVGIDEITTVMQNVPGVVAVNVTGLIRGKISSTGGDLANLGGYASISALNNWMAQHIALNRPFADTTSRLCAFLPVADPSAVPQPAEILVLDPDPARVVLGAMS